MSVIEQRRKALNFSRKYICEVVGICEKTYYLYISGKLPIPSDKLIKLSKLLESSVDYLLGLKCYNNITVTDNSGALLADISQGKIIEYENCKVILT